MTFNYENFFSTLLDNLKDEGRYRTFRTLERHVGRLPAGTIHLDDGTTKDVTIWCSNDYLGMGQNQAVLDAMANAASKHGTGAGGTRNIAGTTFEMVALEKLLAEHHAKEASLVFTSGYTANEGALDVIGRMLPNAIIFSDSLNHASMISGMKRAGCEKQIFPHNDVDALRQALAAQPVNRPKIIAFESVYSMEGDLAPLHDIVKVAKEYGALTYCDEVHGVGLYGDHGAGVAERDNIMHEIDIIEGTFGKAYGLIGGYIAGSAEIIDAVRSFSSSFIFTTALPPSILAGVHASVTHLRNSKTERENLWRNVDYLKFQCKSHGLPILEGEAHIVALVVGDAECCRAVTDRLLHEYNIYVQPINYPTVPKGTERLRLTVSALHTKDHIDTLVHALHELWQTHAIPLAQTA